MRKLLRPAASLVMAGLVVTGAAACGSDDDTAAAGNNNTGSSAASTPTPAAKIDSLQGEMTQVTLDPTFVAGLTALKLTPAPVGNATIDAGVASFPITGGNAIYYTPGTVTPYVQGLIRHDGSGLSLTGGGTKVELTDFEVDPAASMLYGKVTANGKVAVERAPLFFLDGSTLKPLAPGANNTAVLEGTTVSLTKAAADLLNSTYKVTALTEFFPVGVAKITLKTA